MKTHFRLSLVVALFVGLMPGILALAAPAQGQGQQQGQEGQQAQQPPVNPEIEAAQAVMSSADPEEQAKLAADFIQQYPTSPYKGQVLLMAAGAHRMLNHFDDAVKYGELALEVNQQDPIAMLLIADALSEGADASAPNYQQRLSRAENYSHQALDLVPQLFANAPRRPDVPEEQYKMREQYMEAQAHATLGFIYLRREQNAEAEKELRLATEMNQLRPNAADYERLGVALFDQGKYAEAKDVFTKCFDYGGPAFDNCNKRREVAEQKLKQEPQLTPPPAQQPEQPQSQPPQN